MGRTHEALRRAEAKFEKRKFQRKQSPQNEHIDSFQKLENRLIELELGKDQISNKNLKEIGKSLAQIDGYITSPKSRLDIQLNDSETDFKKDVLPILIDRKKLTLDRFNELVSKRKYYNIMKLLQEIADGGIRNSIEKIINELHAKDKILKKEYQKLEQLSLSINGEQQQDLKDVSEEIHKKEPIIEKREKPKKSGRVLNFLGVLIMGLLLICLTLFIALAPFYNMRVPNILNSAFFILLGFFMGLTIAKLARS